MAIQVCWVKAASGGFGEFDLGEPATVEGVETMGEYEALAADNGFARDEESDAAAADADGRIHDQGAGVVVGWRTQDGTIQLECVYVPVS